MPAPLPARRAPATRLPLLLLLGCADPKTRADGDPADPAAAEPADPDSAAPAADSGAPPVDTGLADPWPDPATGGTPGLSVVVDGAVLSDGAVLRVPTAPAGVDHAHSLQFTLTNRGDAPLDLPTDLAEWLHGEGFTWGSPPPAHLEPGESAAFGVEVNPASATAAATWTAGLTVPGGPAATLVAEVPGPLRLVVVTDGPGTLVSDDYGATFTEVEAPPAAAATVTTLAWAPIDGGRFLRGRRDGTAWGDPGVYEHSPDGLRWTAATAADAFWPSACVAWSGFACARDDGFSWSATGETVIHEPTAWGQLLQGLGASPTELVAVGRGGRRAVSLDGRSVNSESFYGGGDGYYRAAWADGVWVAVGGADRLLVSRSEDGGVSWSDQILREARYASMTGLAHSGGVWLASGGGDVWRSTDGGTTWSATGAAYHYLLGAHNGWFFAFTQPWLGTATLQRSRDGLSWSPVHALGHTATPRALAAQGWEG
jgi:hypothetical protein